MKNIFRKLWANEGLIMACLQITKNYCRSRLFSKFIQTQKRYPTSLDKLQNKYENIISGVQLYNKKYHQKLNDF